MFAVTAVRIDADNPLAGLELGERPEPTVPGGWTTVTVKAAALNHHDVWTLRGVGIREDRLPIILGGDAAGIDEDGNEVIVHSVVGDPERGGGDETLDPKRSLLSEVYDGTFAEKVAVPRRNLVPKPASLSFEEAACLPTAWLTAYRMLFDKAGLQPGSTILVQGAGGGGPAVPRTSASAPSSSARIRSSSPGRVCPNRSMRSWRPSARPRGHTR
jgi:NADPH:quinone reductase-like Zn-dependent oxidoreductase